MPRKIDPAKIKVGHGLAASDSVEVNALIPGAGQPGSVGGGGAGSAAHIQDEHDAHAASAVSVDDVPKIYDASNVEGVLDELAALVPPRPPTIGNALHYFHTTGIPDWGILKLDDASWFARNPDQFDLSYGWGWGGKATDPTGGVNLYAGKEVYPYFWRPVFIAENLDKNAPSNDPQTDPTFNVASDSYVGGGVGESHAGKFGENNVTTFRIIPTSGPTGGKKVVVSGVVFPADRGTLALVRFDNSGDSEDGIFFEVVNPEDFKTQRVLAALNLGQGIFDKCDGSPGGIFWLGDHGGDCAPHSYDPFSYPGRATGQLDLYEIHTGKRRKKGEADTDLLAPFYDFDGDGVQGAPAAGQVRLGTDPNAGIPLIPDGIPIFGGTSFARGGGHNQNFFRYRLPYLADYSKPHGLKWTPPSALHRYYDKPSVALDSATPLENAGDYREFERDYWTFQVARYRHQFSLPDDIILDHNARSSGTYVLFHFTKEKYFEECVRDKIMPTKDKLYSANLVRPVNPSHQANIANHRTSYNEALDGGVREADSYHILRANVYEDYLGDKDSEFCHVPVPPIVDGSNQVKHAKANLYMVNETNVHISGVKYFTSGDLGDNRPNFGFDRIDVLLNEPNHDDGIYGLFETSWLSHDHPRGGSKASFNPDDHPDPLSHRNPALLSLFSFTQGYSIEDSVSGTYRFSLKHPEQPDIVSSLGQRRGRVEFSARQLLNPDDGNPVYPESDRQAHLEGYCFFLGDDDQPCFSRDAVMRAFFRRPLNHGRSFLDYAPFYNTGNKIEVEFGGSPVERVLWYGVNHLLDRKPIRYSNYQPFMDLSGEPDCLMYKVGQDREERFLDESYRLRSTFRDADGNSPLSLPYEETLRGPGLPHGTGLVITIPSNGFECWTSPWRSLHWMTSFSNALSLADNDAGMGNELQVAGWPDRNPPIQDGMTTPVLSSGCLIYPKHDYSTAATQPPGPNYSGLSGDRCWVRYFNFHGAENSPKVTIELDGISLDDLLWKTGLPNPGSNKMAVLIKVPGQTTWMDIGRRDGDGPSKQDPFADGAGCMIIGPETKDLDPSDVGATMPNRCVVTCNLGPAATLYNNHDNIQQLLMKVVIYENGASLDLEQGGPNGTHADLRGLVGIRVSPRM